MGIIAHNTTNGFGDEYPGGYLTALAEWTHGGIGVRNGLAVVSACLTTAGGASSSVTATYGGVSMTLHGVKVYGSGSAHRLALFTLINPPTGSQTVSVRWESLSYTLPGKVLTAASATYANVRSVSGYVTNGGYGSTSNLTLNNVTANDVILVAHSRQTQNGFSSYTPTQRFSTSFSTLGRITVGDDTGNTGSVTSTATMSAPDYYASHGIVATRFAEGDFFA